MKLQHILEAKYFGDKRPLWLKDAFTVAETNMERAPNEKDWDFWNEYKDWITTNTKMLNQIYDTLKAERDQHLARFEEPDARAVHQAMYRHTQLPRSQEDNDRREFSAELWASNMSHEEFPIFKEFIRMQEGKEQIDYSMMVGNTMFDILGGLRDEH